MGARSNFRSGTRQGDCEKQGLEGSSGRAGRVGWQGERAGAAGRGARNAVPGCVWCRCQPSPALGPGPSPWTSGERLSRNRHHTCGATCPSCPRRGTRDVGNKGQMHGGKLVPFVPMSPGAQARRAQAMARPCQGGSAGTAQAEPGCPGLREGSEGSGCGGPSSSLLGHSGSSDPPALRPRTVCRRLCSWRAAADVVVLLPDRRRRCHRVTRDFNV